MLPVRETGTEPQFSSPYPVNALQMTHQLQTQQQSESSSDASGKSLARSQPSQPDIYDPHFLAQAMALARQLASSAIIPAALRGKPADVLVTLLKGRELGIGPIQSLSEIFVISGKAGLSAALIAGLCLRERGICDYFTLISSDDAHATYETYRRGAPRPVTLSYTYAQALAAGLTRNPTYTYHRAAMLRARCASALAKAVYPDVCAGVYSQDEVIEMQNRAAAPRAEEPVVGGAHPTPPAGSEVKACEPGQPESIPPPSDSDSPTEPEEPSEAPPPSGEPSSAPLGDSFETLAAAILATTQGADGREDRLRVSRRVMVAMASGRLPKPDVEKLRTMFREKEK